MKMYMLITGFLSIVYNESRRMVKGLFSSYLWFILVVFLSAYSLFSQKYADITIDRSLMAFKSGDSPMADVLIFTTSFAASSASDVLSGKTPSIVFPISVGVIFFVVFSLLPGLALMSNFIIKRASVSIAGEREKKTLYILGASPQTRSSIYLGKFTGIFLLTLPMVGFLYLTARWVFTGLFSSVLDLSGTVLEVSLITVLLFISAGMLVSVLSRSEKGASLTGIRIVAAAALLTVLWIAAPFIEFMLNLTNNSSDFLLVLEKLTWLSPFTLDLASVYAPLAQAGHFNIQIIISLIFLVLGTVTFIRQDIEY